MPEIRSVAILGAGAMGAYFATRFATLPDFSTVFIAAGERRERLNRDGIIVNGILSRIPAVDPQAAVRPVDLILVAVKHNQLSRAIQGLGPLVGPDTVFLSVMNGLESEETIGAVYGMDRVLYAISVGIDALREGSQVRYTRGGTHYFGEARNPSLSPKVLRVRAAFERAGIQAQTPEDMIRRVWWKFMVNVGVNQASAVLRAPYGVFQTNPDAQWLMETLMREVVALAEPAGVNLVEQDIRDWYGFMNGLSPAGKTSMLQDIEAGRETEAACFGGKVIELGRRHAIPTPVNEAVFRMIRALETHRS